MEEQTLKGGRGQCSQCGEWHNNVSWHEAHECMNQPCWDCGKPQDKCDCGIKYCSRCGEEVGEMCVCQGTVLPSDDDDTTPTEQFAERMSRVTAILPPNLEEVQKKAGPNRERISDMLEDIVKEIDYNIYKGLFVNPEDPEYAERQIEELITIVQTHLR